MSTSARQPRFSLSIQGVEPALQVLAFKGEEAISSPFSFDVELVSDRSSIDLASLQHQSAFLAFDEQDNGIHGQISAVSKSCPNARLTHYQLTLVPRVAYLAHRTDQRIFQHQTVQQIIEQVLKGTAFSVTRTGLRSTVFICRANTACSTARATCTLFNACVLKRACIITFVMPCTAMNWCLAMS